MYIHEKIFSKSAALWSDQPGTQNAIQNRLGWLDAPEFSRKHIAELERFKQKVLASDCKQVVLLGMGGSSLAPEVFNRFSDYLPEEQQTRLELIVLDGTCPAQIKKVRAQIDISKTLFIVASKSGGTVETRFLFDYFFGQVAQDNAQPGNRFIAITDPGSALDKLAKQEQFFSCFINPADIGGRYSALSFFGLVPAILLGWDIKKLLDRADQAIQVNKSVKGLGVQLGEWLFKDYKKPTDILYFRYEGVELTALFMWIEQLVAESLGKRAEGLFLAPAKSCHVELSENAKCLNINMHSTQISSFSDAKIATVCMEDEYDIAAQFFHWEFATAIAAAHIGINPFDEPNVAEAKQKTSELLSQANSIELPESNGSIEKLIPLLGASEYLALLVYAQDCPENVQEIDRIKTAIEKNIDIPVTINFGPRYLHSVGQLHKGGKQHGAFLLLLDKPHESIQIPGQAFGFDKLFCAQALGDFQILKEKGLPIEFLAINSLSEIDI